MKFEKKLVSYDVFVRTECVCCIIVPVFTGEGGATSLEPKKTIRSFLYLCIMLIFLFCLTVISLDFVFPVIRMLIVTVFIAGAVAMVIMYNIYKEKL